MPNCRLPSYCRTRAVALISLITAPLAGCVSLTGDCVAIGGFGIHVAVVDAQTGLRPPAATLVLTDGSYADTTSLARSPNPAQGLYAALERPGTYTVTVTAPGYQPWTQSSVTVRRAGSCSTIQTVHLTARLARLP